MWSSDSCWILLQFHWIGLYKLTIKKKNNNTSWDKLNSVCNSLTLESFEQTLVLAFSQLDRTELSANTGAAHRLSRDVFISMARRISCWVTSKVKRAQEGLSQLSHRLVDDHTVYSPPCLFSSTETGSKKKKVKRKSERKKKEKKRQTCWFVWSCCKCQKPG